MASYVKSKTMNAVEVKEKAKEKPMDSETLFNKFHSDPSEAKYRSYYGIGSQQTELAKQYFITNKGSTDADYRSALASTVKNSKTTKKKSSVPIFGTPKWITGFGDALGIKK